MECGEHEVACFSCIHRGFSCFGVTGFTDQDDVGILA